jgi:hypothetical protein
MGPQEPKDLARDTARDLSGLVGELAAEAAMVEARRRVRLTEKRRQ